MTTPAHQAATNENAPDESEALLVSKATTPCLGGTSDRITRVHQAAEPAPSEPCDHIRWGTTSWCSKCGAEDRTLLVACISRDGITLNARVDDFAQDIDGLFEPEDDMLGAERPFTIGFKRMTQAEFDALGDFDGF